MRCPHLRSILEAESRSRVGPGRTAAPITRAPDSRAVAMATPPQLEYMTSLIGCFCVVDDSDGCPPQGRELMVHGEGTRADGPSRSSLITNMVRLALHALGRTSRPLMAVRAVPVPLRREGAPFLGKHRAGCTSFWARNHGAQGQVDHALTRLRQLPTVHERGEGGVRRIRAAGARARAPRGSAPAPTSSSRFRLASAWAPLAGAGHRGCSPAQRSWSRRSPRRRPRGQDLGVPWAAPAPPGGVGSRRRASPAVLET